jgi:hypothetical protein
MLSLSIDGSMSGETLRAGQVTVYDDGEIVRLEIPNLPLEDSPFEYGRLMQLIITWGLRHDKTRLKLGASGDWAAHLRRSDVVLVACLVAEEIEDLEGADVSRQLQEVALQVCVERNLLSHVDATPVSRLSIILPAFIPNLAHSSELQFQHDNRWSLNEEARSLYQDIWPASESTSTLRAARGSDGERLVADGHGVRVHRNDWPVGHPAHNAKGTFKTLAARAFPGSDDFESSINEHHQSRPISDQMGEVLFELVQNTEWHADPIPGGETGRNLRAFSFCQVEVTHERIAALSSTDLGFATYLSRLLRSASAGPVVVAIANIIDSGNGLAYSAARRAGRQNEIEPENEVYFFREALDKTIRVMPRRLSEYGLPRVQLLLSSLGGFMSIHSGNLGVRRDFIEKPFANGYQNLAPGSLSQFERFIDWVPPDEEGMNQGPRVGTDVMIVVPLDSSEAGHKS